MIKPHVIVVGAGFTGCAAAHDLALRGVQVTVIERGEIASGTSGRTHGLLHSGARYCVGDQESALECIQENQILRRIVPEVIEPNGGLFIALNEEDLAYAGVFALGADACGIPVQRLNPNEACRLEPEINPHVLMAFLVPDGVFEPLRLALAFAATARYNGVVFKPYQEVKELLRDAVGHVMGVKVWDRVTNQMEEIRAEVVLNCAGSWAGQLAALAGLHVPIQPTPGVMVAFDRRLTQRTINRLGKPSDGDIVLPQRRMMVVGTTSFEISDLDYIPVFQDQVEEMVQHGVELIPNLRHARMRGAYMSSRPLVGKSSSARSMARTFRCFDHSEEGVPGLFTVTGGKATTCRAMAEKAVDLVCQKINVRVECQTMSVPLHPYRTYYQS